MVYCVLGIILHPKALKEEEEGGGKKERKTSFPNSFLLLKDFFAVEYISRTVRLGNAQGDMEGGWVDGNPWLNLQQSQRGMGWKSPPNLLSGRLQILTKGYFHVA